VTTTLVFLTSACSSTGASYDQKTAYLHTDAVRGAQMHTTLLNEKEQPSQPRCVTAYQALTGTNHLAVDQNDSVVNGTYVPDDAPHDVSAAAGNGQSEVSVGYAGQIRDFYITSCVTGVPKPVPGQPAAATTSAATSSR
jgi:hypothetical protein